MSAPRSLCAGCMALRALQLRPIASGLYFQWGCSGAMHICSCMRFRQRNTARRSLARRWSSPPQQTFSSGTIAKHKRYLVGIITTLQVVVTFSNMRLKLR